MGITIDRIVELSALSKNENHTIRYNARLDLEIDVVTICDLLTSIIRSKDIEIERLHTIDHQRCKDYNALLISSTRIEEELHSEIEVLKADSNQGTRNAMSVVAVGLFKASGEFITACRPNEIDYLQRAKETFPMYEWPELFQKELCLKANTI